MQPDPSRPVAFPSPPGVAPSLRPTSPGPAASPSRAGQRAQDYAARVPAPVEQVLFEDLEDEALIDTAERKCGARLGAWVRHRPIPTRF